MARIPLSVKPRYRAVVIPERDLEHLRRWAATRVPFKVHEELRIEVEVSDRALTVVERRPPWKPDFGPDWTSNPVARLRYTKKRNEWSLYWVDRNGAFHEYDFPPSPNIQDLIEEIDRDPTFIFWG